MDDFQNLASFDDFEIENGSNIEYEPICINLLPGEDFVSFDSLNYGCRLAVTNFRLIIIYDTIKDKNTTSDIISIPLGLIYHLEQYGFICLSIVTKIGRRFSVRFPNIELCEEVIKKIKNSRALKPFSIELYNALTLCIPSHFLLNDIEDSSSENFEFDLISKEFNRMKFSVKDWTISDINKDFELCSTYPRFNIVPITSSDDIIRSMSKFRSKNRFISVTFRCNETGTVMMRSGQPLTGVSCWRNNADESFFGLINDLSKPSDCNRTESFIKVFDARSYAFAQLNRVKGGGMESEEYYQKTKVEFLNIPNMHCVRSSFESLSKSFLETENDNFYDLVSKSGWLQLIRQLLKSATLICDTMYLKRKSVLVHCSDGWDRTPQLVSLAQIIMDPFYRTIDGFKTLICREWILFGHRFEERCALWPFDYSQEYSPIFLQFLDCVYQLLQQFPDHFHFSETFLIKLALHVFSGLFGTFNKSLSKSNDSCSIWSFLCQTEITSFINPLYSPSKSFKIMRPKLQLLNIKLWSRLYFDSLNPNYHEIQYPEKFTCELPPEINNISMFNSIIAVNEEMDDYEGEEIKYQPILLPEILNIENKPCFSKVERRQSTINNYFKPVYLRCSLERIDPQPTCDPKIHFELDLDGLFKQMDYVERFSDFHRHRRHLYKSQIEHYRNEMENFQRRISIEIPAKNNIEECGERLEDLYDSDGSQSWDDQCFTIENVILWIPDHAVTHCSSCKGLFTVLNRKHHCRSCGLIFCNTCSQHKTTIPKQKLNWLVRVCDKCYSFLGCNEDSQSNCSFWGRFFQQH